MKKLSKWGSLNPVLSRTIIILSHILILINGIFFGLLLSLYNLPPYRWPLLTLVILFFCFCLLYPIKGIKTGIFKHTYKRQKSLDFLLVISYFLIISLGVNNYIASAEMAASSKTSSARLISYTAPPIDGIAKGKESKSELRKKRKQFRKNLKAELIKLRKTLKEKGEKKKLTWLKTLLIFLTLYAAIGLSYLVTILGCELACSGAGGLAFLVYFGGLGGIVVLTVIAIKNIVKIGRPKPLVGDGL